MSENTNELEKYQKLLMDNLQLLFGKEPEIQKKLQILITDCEFRIKRRVKPSSTLKIYENYYDVLFDMVKVDYQLLGTEGELSREVNGVKSTFSSVRPSDEILSTIPLFIGVRK